MTKALTDAAIRKYRPGPERRRIRDAGSRSLFLVIEPSGFKAFEMRFRRGAKITKIRLGSFDLTGHELEGAPQIGQPLTLAAARMVAADVLRQRALGADVVGEHRAEKRRRRIEAADRQGNTFGAAVRDFIDERVKLKKTRNWRATAQLLGLGYPRDGGEPEVIKDGLVERWADKPVREIDGHLVHGVIDEARRIGSPGIKARNKGLSDARGRLLFVALSGLFGWLQRERRVETNPLKSVSSPAPSASRDRVLDDAEIKIFWKACEEVGEPFGSVFKMLLLTGGRLNEVARMTRDELSDDGTWSLSGARTKNKRPHVVPLPAMAMETIGALPKIEGNFVFTTSGKTPVSGWSRVKRRLDAAMLKIAREERGKDAKVAPFRIHDLRRSFVTGCAELGIRPDVIEQAINHVSGTRASVAGVYNRSQLLPERKMALERWASHVEGLVSGRPAKVVPISKGRGRGR
jgi:integrase